MSRYALVVTTSVTDNKTQTALDFAQQLLAQGHHLIGVFFYQDGVTIANTQIIFPSDEVNLAHKWQQFHHNTKVPLHLCITAAERRGLIEGNHSETSNISGEFTVSGLGELVVLTNSADKAVQL